MIETQLVKALNVVEQSPVSYVKFVTVRILYSVLVCYVLDWVRNRALLSLSKLEAVFTCCCDGMEVE